MSQGERPVDGTCSDIGLLLDLPYDDRAGLDRKSDLIRMFNGRQQVVEILPALNKK